MAQEETDVKESCRVPQKLRDKRGDTGDGDGPACVGCARLGIHNPNPPQALRLRNSLAAAVFVSAGRWELDGTTLRWWCPVPRLGEPDCEYSIVVARRGGRIVTKEEMSCDVLGRR